MAKNGLGQVVPFDPMQGMSQQPKRASSPALTFTAPPMTATETKPQASPSLVETIGIPPSLLQRPPQSPAPAAPDDQSVTIPELEAQAGLPPGSLDPQEAAELAAEMGLELDLTGGPLEAPPLPQGPQPIPGVIPTDPIVPGAVPPGAELAPAPGGVIVAQEPKSSKAAWGLLALVVLGGGIAAWYYTRQE